MIRRSAIAVALFLLPAPVGAQPGDEPAAEGQPDALLFDPARDAMADIDAALTAAAAGGRHVMIIFGGDWCHDSRALTELFAQDRFAAMLADRYEIVHVHVPRAHDQRSIAAGHRFGLGNIVGTPTVLILTADGRPTNLTDAPRWRNAASRKPDAIYRYFARTVAPVR